MKPAKSITSQFLSVLLFTFVSGQSFLNGNFEINTVPAFSCAYNLDNATFNSMISNTIGYGGGGELDIIHTSCTYGTAQNGNWYVAMAYPSMGDAFTMQLSSPLVAGNTYYMCYYDTGADVSGCCPPTASVQIGVSTSSIAQGTVVYTSPVPAINSWNQRSFSFVAPNNGQFISVSITAWRWTHVDNFLIGNVPSCVILSSSFSDFNVQNKGNFTNEVSWNAENEEQVKEYFIQRSADGIHFETLSLSSKPEISAAGNYKMNDNQFPSGTNFYRIQSMNFDGSATYSEIREIVNEWPSAFLSVLPNPNQGSFTLHHSLQNSDEITRLLITDASGRVVYERQSVAAEFQNLEINPMLNPGIYVVMMQNSSFTLNDRLVILK